MTIQLIETGEEDFFLAVARHVGSLLSEPADSTAGPAEAPASPFAAECEALLSAGDSAGFMAKMIGQLDLVYAKASAQDVECIVNALIHSTSKVPVAQVDGAIASFASALSRGDDRPEERLAALANLHGVCATPGSQYVVLKQWCSFAQKSRALASNVAATLKGRADDVAQSLRLPAVQEVELYLLLAGVFRAAGDRSSFKEYLKLVTIALRKAAPGAATTNLIKSAAIGAVADFVRHPDVYSCDLLGIPALDVLATDADFAPLHRLLTAMLQGDIQAFKAAATKPVLDMLGATLDAALGKARMLALLVLGCKSTHEELPFGAIQAALDIGPQEVEVWIIRAIGKKLLDGRIDQVRQLVSIHQCSAPSFGPGEWAGLRAQLNSWRDSMHGVLAQIAAQKTQADLAGVNSGAPGGKGITQAIRV